MVHCTGWINCSWIKQTPSRMDVLFLLSIFRFYPGFKLSFEHNNVRIKLFLSACFCWDSRLSLREMDQKHKFGGTIGYGNSYLELFFRQFKIFRLHAILHDAARSVWANRSRLLLHDQTRTKFIFARSRDWITLLPLRKNLSTLQFQFCWFLKQYVLHCTRYRANSEKHN